MKKIIFSTYDDIKNPYYGGGGALAIHNIAKRISKQFSIKVISWNHSGLRQEVIDGVSYRRIGINIGQPKVEMLMFQVVLPVYTFLLDYDIWVESFGPPFTTSLLSLFTNKPLVGVVHMLASEDMERKYKLPIFKYIEKMGLFGYKKIIATSLVLKKKLLKINKDLEIEIISNGVDKVVKKASVKKKNQILSIGRIEVDQKGLDMLIKIFEYLKNKLRGNWKLVIAGSGTSKELKKLKKLINKSVFKSDIELVGKVERTQKERLFNQSQILLTTSRFDTFSMTTLEGLAHGLPVVAFNLNTLGWTPKKSVIKVKQFEIVDFSDSVFKVLKNKKLIKEMSAEGIDFARKYTWENIAKRYVDYLNKI